MKLTSCEERLMQILIAPRISEKATRVTDKSEQVIFIVLPDAKKSEIKAAVELLFKVAVKSVQVTNIKGKLKRTGRNMGYRSTTRKAFVCLRQGQEISFASLGGGV